MGMRRWALAFLAAAVACTNVAFEAARAEEATPTPFIKTRAGDLQAVVGDGYIAWTKSVGKSGRQLYVRKMTGGRPVHVNRPGKEALLGGISNGKLVFQEFTKKRTAIRFMDLSSGRRWNAPAAVNRKGTWEFTVAMSGDWIAYARYNSRRMSSSIMAYNLKTRRERKLDEFYGGNPAPPYVQVGQMAGRYVVSVVWEGPYYYSTLVVHDLEKPYKAAVPIASYESYLWAPSVQPNGTVYALTTGNACGAEPTWVRWVRDRGYYPPPGVTIARMPQGIDSAHSHAYIDEDGTAQVLIQWSPCSDPVAGADIYSFSDMVTLGVVKDGLGSGTVTSTPAGISCGEDCSETLAPGTTVVLEAVPDLGSKFTGWSACKKKNATCEVQLSEDLQVYAYFEPGV